MLRSLQLENFKAFGERTVIPLAPITLIFGQNSSGKSSILQSLNLLKQTRESRDVEALLLPRTENGFVDLGSFQEMLFDHDLNRVLRIRLDVETEGLKRDAGIAPRFLSSLSMIGLEFLFSRKRPEDEITLEEISLCGDDPEDTLAVFENCSLPKNMRRYAGPIYRSDRRRSPTYLRGAKCKSITKDPRFWQESYKWSVKEKKRLYRMLMDAKSYFAHEINAPAVRSLFDDEEVTGEGVAKLRAALEDYAAFVSSDFTSDQYIARMISEQEEQFVGLDGFIPTLSGRSEKAVGLDALLNRSMNRPSFRRDWTLDVGMAAVYAGRVVEQALVSLFPLGPFRKPPSRWYIFTGTTPQDVGYEGNLLPDFLFRQHEVRKKANEWLEKLDIGYEIKIHPLGRSSSDLFELRLLDTRRKNAVEVGLSDVGFGISQILPLVVQSLAASDQIISVEQPEVHIHPRLQADLGDLFIEASKAPLRNQFIIETHSEHLALRLQRRVREGLISPESISIVYVSRGPDGATVKPLRLDEEGDFMDEFPGGFFPERLRELR
jgi:hypothetical protein